MIEPGWNVAVALLPFAGLIVELILLRLRWLPYFQAGFPLPLELVPISTVPQGEGTTASVCWAADDQGIVRWWANPTSSEGLTGLHGAVRCVRTTRGVQLYLRWSPPWTPLLAAVVLAGFGAVRGVPHVTIPIAVLIVFGLVGVYYQGAVRAAAELRWSFVRGEGTTG